MPFDGITASRKLECEQSGLYFNRLFFKQRFGTKMVMGRHHAVIQAALDRTLLPPDDPQFISRLIINVPPGYTKTELASIGYMSRGLALNSSARFLHLSYSDKLVLLNSGIAREIVKSPLYQSMWPIQVKNDTDSKKIWHTSKNGGITATSANGQVTGFRAGHMDYSKFTGALIIDDAVKPDDANSEVMREGVNESYNETIASRVSIETNPIVVIMQRLHWNDLSGYLLRGGSGEKWHHLLLPVKIDNAEPYLAEYTHGIQIEHGLPDGWLWPFKHNEKNETALASHRRKYAAQYKQAPIKRDSETQLWTEATINRAKINIQNAEDATQTVVSVDPAVSNNPTSDEHGIVVVSKYPGEHNYSVDGDYTLRGSPKEWADRAILAYHEHNADSIVIETNQGGDMCEDTLRNAGFKGKIDRVHASKGKIARAEPIAALYEQNFVKHRSGLLLLEDEMMDLDPLTGKAAGKSPNRVDALVWGVSKLSGDDFGELLKLALG